MPYTDFSKYDCGADGVSFSNGLPDEGETVQVKTVWSNGAWQEKVFAEKYGHEKWHQYDWFSVYSKPRIDEGSMPIVLEWRRVS